MRYQKEFEYIYETIEKLHVTIITQSEALPILAENDFDKDDSKDLHTSWLQTFTLLEFK